MICAGAHIRSRCLDYCSLSDESTRPVMRHFLYVSDSKVDMLLPQIPAAIKKTVSAEIGFDVKLLTGKIATARETLEDRIHRLMAVEKYIRKTQAVGTIDDPKSWIAGNGNALVSEIKQDARTVFFFLRSLDVNVALGGSAGHIIGANPQKTTSLGYSFMPHLLKGLREIDRIPEIFNQSDEELEEYAGSGVCSPRSHPWSAAVYYACERRQNRTFDIPITFLARKIVSEAYMDKRVILATPLYVALADE